MFDFLTRVARAAERAGSAPLELPLGQQVSVGTAEPRRVPAAVGEEPTVGPEGPSIALVLGGGAARGFAHVGVLRTLLAHGLKPNIVVGASIGAVVGGCYAAGLLDDFEKWARGLSRRRIFGYLDFSLAGSGLIEGARLARTLHAALDGIMIEKLPVRFAAIATEIRTAHEIWLTRGRLADALRASYALPGVFAPVRLGQRWLMDGALVNPVPVSAARALGARVVIAVDLNADIVGRGATIPSHGSDESDERDHAAAHPWGLPAMFGPERMIKRQLLGAAGRPGLFTVMMEAFNIMQDRITRARLAGDPPDVIIRPTLGGISLIDFHRAAETIALGAEAAQRTIDPIAEVIRALR